MLVDTYVMLISTSVASTLYSLLGKSTYNVRNIHIHQQPIIIRYGVPASITRFQCFR